MVVSHAVPAIRALPQRSWKPKLTPSTVVDTPPRSGPLGNDTLPSVASSNENAAERVAADSLAEITTVHGDRKPLETMRATDVAETQRVYVPAVPANV